MICFWSASQRFSRFYFSKRGWEPQGFNFFFFFFFGIKKNFFFSAAWAYVNANMGHTAKSFAWTDVAEALLHFGGQTGLVCWSAQLTASAALLKPYPVVLWRQRSLEAFWGTGRRGQAVLKYVQWVYPVVCHPCNLNFLDTNNLSHLSQATSAFLWDELWSQCSRKTLGYVR